MAHEVIREFATARIVPHGWVDAEPYTMLLGSLYRRGETITSIAEASTLSVHTVARVVFGETRRVQARTARLLEMTARVLDEPA